MFIILAKSTSLNILAHESSHFSIDSKQSLGNSRPTDFSNY